MEYLKKRCRGKVEDKLGVIEALREAGYEVDEVFIATDPDAEGEKIAYDLYLLVRSFNASVKRAEFHEVTPKAFREAIDNPPLKGSLEGLRQELVFGRQGSDPRAGLDYRTL